MIGLALVPIANTIWSHSNSNSLPATGTALRLHRLHLDTAHGADIALVVGKNFDRSGEPVEFDALLLGVMNLFRARRAFRPRPPVDAIHFLGAEPQADAHGVHGGVAGADYGDAFSKRKRGIEIREFLRPHQVAAGQQLVGGKHAIERIAGA